MVELDDDTKLTLDTSISRPHSNHTATIESSVTHVYDNAPYHGGAMSSDHSESPIPAHSKEDDVNCEDDWENDLFNNPRNWPAGKKWTMVVIVGRFFAISSCRV